MTAHDARVLIQVEYLETPTLRLSQAQIARLCDVPDNLCGDALETLVWTGFLSRAWDGYIVRSGVGRRASSLDAPVRLAGPAR